MHTSFLMITILFLLQVVAGCASHHNDRFPSSHDEVTEEYYRENPRFRR